MDEKKPKLCLPLRCTSRSALLSTIERVEGEYDLFEVWLDSLDDLTPAFARELAEGMPGRSVFMLRGLPYSETRMSEALQREILSSLSGKDALVDLDIVHQLHDLEWIQREKLSLRLVTSFHDFSATPRKEHLVGIVNEMSRFAPEIVKLATLCHRPDDAVLLLQTGLDLRRHGYAPIVLGMGEYGMATRVFGGLWYNAFVYAPLTREEATAPGQLTGGELRTILDSLRGYVG